MSLTYSGGTGPQRQPRGSGPAEDDDDDVTSSRRRPQAPALGRHGVVRLVVGLRRSPRPDEAEPQHRPPREGGTTSDGMSGMLLRKMARVSLKEGEIGN